MTWGAGCGPVGGVEIGRATDGHDRRDLTTFGWLGQREHGGHTRAALTPDSDPGGIHWELQGIPMEPGEDPASVVQLRRPPAVELDRTVAATVMNPALARCGLAYGVIAAHLGPQRSTDTRRSARPPGIQRSSGDQVSEDDDVVQVVLDAVERSTAGDQANLRLGEVAVVDVLGGELVLGVERNLVDDKGGT